MAHRQGRDDDLVTVRLLAFLRDFRTWCQTSEAELLLLQAAGITLVNRDIQRACLGRDALPCEIC